MNLRLLNETTASSVASVSITDVFTSDFDIYKMTMVYDNSAGNVLKTQMINPAGTAVDISNYEWAVYQMRAAGSFQEQQSASDSSWRMSYEGTEGWNVTTYLFNPCNQSAYTFYTTESSGHYGGAGLTSLHLRGIGVLEYTALMTGIKFSVVGSNLDDFTCRIYGVRIDT